MANRQALKDLQERLAQRLTAARSESATASWLAVEAGGQRYLLPLVQSGEIFSWTDMQRVPYVQSWFLGVANLRGGLYGLVDLASFLRGGAGQQRGEAALGSSRLVALNPLLETNCALLVDRLLGLRTTEAFASSTAPDAAAPAYFGHVYTDLEGRQWQELNLQSLSQHPAFLGVGA